MLYVNWSPLCYRYSLVESGADIPWIQGITKLPLVIKGIQSVEVRGELLYYKPAVIPSRTLRKRSNTACKESYYQIMVADN